MSQTEPGDREEMLLLGILNGDTETNIEPGSRKEALLKAILENGGGNRLPEYGAGDNGKVLGISDDGELTWTASPSGNLPNASDADNGRALAVDGGEWAKSVNIVAMKDVTDTVEADVIKPVPGTVNIYDEDHNSIWVTSGDVPSETETQYKRGTVYLDGYTGDIVTSSDGQKGSYITDLHVYDGSGADMGVDFASGYVNETSGDRRQGKKATVPNGAVYLTFKYRIMSSSGAVVTYPMVTKGGTIGDGTYIPYSAHFKIVDTVKSSVGAAAYVSPDGSDGNDGLSASTPVRTFSRALGISDIIYAERGVYDQSIAISGRRGVRIYPTDNDDEYSSGVKRQKIELSGGYKIPKTDMTASGDMYTAACGGGFQFNEIFKTQTLDPIAGNGAYRANVFVHLTVAGKKKLKPVLSQALCEAESDTFWWDATNEILYMNVSTADFDSVTVLTSNNRITIEDCSDVVLVDVAANCSYGSVIRVDNSNGVVFNDCEASYSGTNMGFEINNSNVRFEHCYATCNWYDGFNFHGYGYSEMNDCISEYNWDDGCSHHNGCIGTVTGGEFVGNGKGGVTPAYGANVNIYGILAAGNDTYGVGFLYAAGNPAMRGLIAGSALVGNPTGLRVGTNWTVNAVGVKYSGNTTDKLIEGTCNEY